MDRRRSSDMLAGMMRLILYPLIAAAIASAMPVLPGEMRRGNSVQRVSAGRARAAHRARSQSVKRRRPAGRAAGVAARRADSRRGESHARTHARDAASSRTAGRLDQRVTRLNAAGALRLLYHTQRRPVLDAARRVVALELQQDGVASRRGELRVPQPLQAHKRRVAHGVLHRLIDGRGGHRALGAVAAQTRSRGGVGCSGRAPQRVHAHAHGTLLALRTPEDSVRGERGGVVSGPSLAELARTCARQLAPRGALAAWAHAALPVRSGRWTMRKSGGRKGRPAW